MPYKTFLPADRPEDEAADRLFGLVSAVHREQYEVLTRRGSTRAVLKASVYYGGNELYPTVGDIVRLDWQPAGESRITATMPRQTYFSRLDPSSFGHWEQAVAANFSYVFILQSLNHDFNLARAERYLTLAWQSGAQPVIVLTKADLTEDPAFMVAAAQGIAFGVPVLAVSAVTGQGMEELVQYLAPGKSVVLLGSSGVGKSSLVNALMGEETMAVGAIREDDSRGRHTTTHRQLLFLPSGAAVIDTPGMRELGMWDVSKGIGSAFADVEQWLGQCRFGDCTHQTEPGCAVLAALERGDLSYERWQSYQKLRKEARYADDKDGYLKEKWKRNKEIAQRSRQIKNKKR